MIRSDYLPRICQPGVVNDVFNNGRKAFEVGATPTDVPTMPIEFSVAAFRLGHSMVRPHYNWNKNFPSGQGTLPLLFEFSALGGTLGGEARLLTIWVADFRRLYDFGEAGRADLVVSADKFNRAMRIDSLIANPLQHLPPQTVALPNSTPGTDVRRNLAFRNLTRARMVKLATGQQMANFLKSEGREPRRSSRRRRSATGAAAPTWPVSLRHNARRCCATRPCGSTCCARRS